MFLFSLYIIALINRFALDLAWTMNLVEFKKSEPVDISFALVYMVKHGTKTILGHFQGGIPSGSVIIADFVLFPSIFIVKMHTFNICYNKISRVWRYLLFWLYW